MKQIDDIVDMALDVRAALKVLDLGYRTSRSAPFDELNYAMSRINDIIALAAPERLEDEYTRPIAGRRDLKEIARMRINAGGDRLLLDFKRD